MCKFKRPFIFIILAAILLASGLSIMFPSHKAYADTKQKFFLIIPGFNTSSSDPDAFTKIESMIINHYPGAQAIKYSYQGPNQSYNPLITVAQSLDTDVARINAYMISSAIQNKDVYLIGHSLGGDIATMYASEFSGFPGSYNAQLAGVINLDSPINGVSLNSNVAPCINPAINWITSAIGQQYIPIINEIYPGSPDVNIMQAAGGKIPVLSIASADDCFISPSETTIAGGENDTVHSGGTSGDIGSLHGAVRDDTNAINLINSWIDRGDSIRGNGTGVIGGTPATTTPTPTSTPAPSANCTSAPSITAPINGQTVDRSVTFSWNAPTTCVPDGYTFRINQSNDPEEQPFIVDTGWAPSNYNFTFSSNGTYYMHVRACKTCTPFNPGPWSIAQITVVAGASQGFQVCSGTNYSPPAKHSVIRATLHVSRLTKWRVITNLFSLLVAATSITIAQLCIMMQIVKHILLAMVVQVLTLEPVSITNSPLCDLKKSWTLLVAFHQEAVEFFSTAIQITVSMVDAIW